MLFCSYVLKWEEMLFGIMVRFIQYIKDIRGHRTMTEGGIMDFFNKVGATISTKSKDAAKKVREAGEVVKLNSQVSGKESEIKKLYSEIGKYVFENQTEGLPEEITSRIEQVKGLMKDIEALKEQVKSVKGIQNCEVCGAEISDGVAFCPKCGSKVPEKVVEEAVEEATEETTKEVAAEDSSEESTDAE